MGSVSRIFQATSNLYPLPIKLDHMFPPEETLHILYGLIKGLNRFVMKYIEDIYFHHSLSSPKLVQYPFKSCFLRMGQLLIIS